MCSSRTCTLTLQVLLQEYARPPTASNVQVSPAIRHERADESISLTFGRASARTCRRDPRDGRCMNTHDLVNKPNDIKDCTLSSLHHSEQFELQFEPFPALYTTTKQSTRNWGCFHNVGYKHPPQSLVHTFCTSYRLGDVQGKSGSSSYTTVLHVPHHGFSPCMHTWSEVRTLGAGYRTEPVELNCSILHFCTVG